MEVVERRLLELGLRRLRCARQVADARGRRAGEADGAAGELGAREEASHRRRGAMGLIGGFFWRLVGEQAGKKKEKT